MWVIICLSLSRRLADLGQEEVVSGYPRAVREEVARAPEAQIPHTASLLVKASHKASHI
jgi:hypothetical protein